MPLGQWISLKLTVHCMNEERVRGRDFEFYGIHRLSPQASWDISARMCISQVSKPLRYYGLLDAITPVRSKVTIVGSKGTTLRAIILKRTYP